MDEQTAKKIGLFILAITFYLNYKMNQIYIMYMYLINVNFISATVINSLTDIQLKGFFVISDSYSK